MPPDEFRLSPLARCPACKEKLDCATTLETGDGPQPGDFSICLYCHSVLRFIKQAGILTYRLSSLNEADDQLREELQKIIRSMEPPRLIHRPPNPAMDEGYLNQIGQMADNARAWRAANPDREALVQFNYPKTVMLIAPISEAIANKYVSTNEAGLELINALWPQDIQSEPSVLMVRVALEL